MTVITHAVSVQYPLNQQTPLNQGDLDQVTNGLRTVVLDANRTEDQSTENLAAVLNIFERIVDESVVLDNQVSPSPYLPYISIDHI